MVPVDIKALGYWIKKESNACKFFKNCVGKTPRFSAIDAKGIRFILPLVNCQLLSGGQYLIKVVGIIFNLSIH
jgi:hypothetical protein